MSAPITFTAYAKTDDSNVIIAINSSAFLTDITNWTVV